MTAEIDRIRRLNGIGVALSAERDGQRLLGLILSGARELTGADGGTIYTVDEERRQLAFALVQNDTLGLRLGGDGEPVGEQFPAIPLYLANGRPNERMVAAWSVLHNRTVLIADAYHEEGFDFSGTQAFDARTGYRSRSFLTVPLCNHEGEIIAALQLLNKVAADGAVVAFDLSDQALAESLASQAAVALTNQRLIAELRELFEGFIRVIAQAIDTKSPHTGAHCRRVPDAALLLADAASRSSQPALAHFRLDDAEAYALKLAVWLHDCGKIVTPAHVMEKSLKLEGFFDRMELVSARFEIIRRDLEIALLRHRLEVAGGRCPPVEDAAAAYGRELESLQADLDFLRRANAGDEALEDGAAARIAAVAARTWRDMEDRLQPLLTEEEQMNLSIQRGTLNPQERRIMEDHVTTTLGMLEELPFPRRLRQVPEYAGGHHERVDGRGYPRGLSGRQLSIPARIIGMADVFEALTAPDRPYKKPMPLSEALTVMGRMVEDGHLDPDLFAVFVGEGVYLAYGRLHLRPEQIDGFDPRRLPGLKRVEG